MRILIFLLLAPFAALAQGTPYYLGGGLDNFDDQMIRGTNPIYVTLFGQDSLIISTSAEAYQHASAYKRTPGEAFLRRTKQWGSAMPNFVFIDNRALLLIEEGGSYLLFLNDENTATTLLNQNDKSAVLHLKDSLRSMVVAINTRQRAESGKIAGTQNKKIVTAFMRGYHSRRNDGVLAADIKKWSRNTNTTVYVVDADYYITRNYRGEVLNKNIPALIKYKVDGKCYVQWRAFGYEALGGGNFSKDLSTYNKNNYFIQAAGAGGSLRLEPGVAYEIDCD